jgi:hypothetical protein
VHVNAERAALAATGLDIVWRSTWGARTSLYSSDRRVVDPARWLFLHITVTEAPDEGEEYEAARWVESIGVARFGIGVPYNALVTPAGVLLEGQPLGRRGAHTVHNLYRPGRPSIPEPNPAFPRSPWPYGMNLEARALAFVAMDGDPFPDAALESAARWGAALRLAGFAEAGARWHGHREVSNKGCPGSPAWARLPELQRRTDALVAAGHVEDDDMPTPEDVWAFLYTDAGAAVARRLGDFANERRVAYENRQTQAAALGKTPQSASLAGQRVWHKAYYVKLPQLVVDLLADELERLVAVDPANVDSDELVADTLARVVASLESLADADPVDLPVAEELADEQGPPD